MNSHSFGPLGYLDISQKREVFEELCNIYNGSFKIKNTISNDLTTYILKVPYKSTEIILTESDTKPLKIKINFQSKIFYELSIYNEDFIEKVLKYFGKKEIEIDNKSFNEKYLIKSNDSSLTIKLLNRNIVNQMLVIDFFFNDF